MKSIYIVGIIILMGETECFIEDTASIKILEEQSTLLRKLQNFQDPKDEKPLTWNEMLADVLVNRIKIFSFHKVNDNEIFKEDSKPSKTTNIIVSCFSQVMLFYKNCIYDRWATKFEEPGFAIDETPTEDNNGVIKNDFEWDNLNDDVEIIEPKYHGKQMIAEAEADEDGAVLKCPEGAVKDEKGNCVNSPLMISVPSQCPIGYRPDRLASKQPNNHQKITSNKSQDYRNYERTDTRYDRSPNKTFKSDRQSSESISRYGEPQKKTGYRSVPGFNRTFDRTLDRHKLTAT